MLLIFAGDGRDAVAGPFDSWECCASVKSGDVEVAAAAASEEAVVVVAVVVAKFVVVASLVTAVEVAIEDGIVFALLPVQSSSLEAPFDGGFLP